MLCPGLSPGRGAVLSSFAFLSVLRYCQQRTPSIPHRARWLDRVAEMTIDVNDGDDDDDDDDDGKQADAGRCSAVVRCHADS